jgi:NAD(P)-dependent dehydrogenase (short-subunit alcohol dehydrogenase family)
MSSSPTEARTVVITGGASGIGKAVALLCAKRGDNVAVLDRDEDGANITAGEATRNGAKGALGLRCNVASEKEIEESFEQVHERFGAPYWLFANAGIDVGGLVHELPLESWHLVLETNLPGVFLSSKHALRRMIAARIPGSIVCTSSPTGFVALAAGAAGAYSATKAGISALVRCMAIDYAHYGIRVNAIVPGATETHLMWNNVPAEEIPQMRDQVSKEIPLGRLAQPEDPAKAVLWLLSEESSYVTGSHLVCDGGILAKSCISV